MELPQRKISINLTGESKELIGKILTSWAIKYGRIIIVVTELIALLALFYRFNKDREIIDLHDQIKLKEGVIISLAPREIIYRDIQDRLSKIKAFTQSTEKSASAFTFVLHQINPVEFQIENVSLSKEVITIKGTSISVSAIDALINTFKSNETITSISLDEIEGREGEVGFKLQLHYVLPEILEQSAIKQGSPSNNTVEETP